MKRLLITGLIVVFIFMLPFCLSEADTTEYVGGVVERKAGSYRVRGLIEELNVAYLTCDKAYLTGGEQAKWTIVAAGGDGIYSYEFRIYHRSGNSGLFSYEGAQALSSSNVFYHTPNQTAGQYLLEVRVYDSAGAYIKWQSPVYETGANEGGAVSKAKEIVNECLLKAGSSDYARALWLHDWLIENADYDHNYEYYYADGVLLHGKGVCQSYAYAYEMMLKMIGIDCVYITGTAGGEAHGWNLVKIAGEWYHVDVTWDDPAPGYENRLYFCVTDEVIAKDHAWERGSGILPECDSEEYLYSGMGGVIMVYDEIDLNASVVSVLKEKQRYAEFLYRGEDEEFVLYESIGHLVVSIAPSSGAVNYKMTYDENYVVLQLDYGKGYADLSNAQVIEIEEETVTLSKGETYVLTVHALPLSASGKGIAWTSSNEACAYSEDGRIHAVRPGEAVITARTADGYTKSVTVRVKAEEYVRIPSGVTKIEEEAFMNASFLQSVIVPCTVTEIGDRAFSGCTLLYEIRLPESVERISDSAFENCPHLTVYTSEGSFAHVYALEHEISFEIITESTLNSD